MQSIQKPNFDIEQAYKDCYQSSREENNCQSLEQDVFRKYQEYDKEASNQNLYSIQDNSGANSIKWLYENKMSRVNTKARIYYDRLKSLADPKVCPFCGIGEISTLDHYLPKSKFPIFSVLPYNLIACCSDCNKKKIDVYAKKQGEQVLHPYYDNKFYNEKWLFARVIQKPLSIEFYIKVPQSWSVMDEQRVETHFKTYDLSKRFSVQASVVLSELYFRLALVNDVKSFLSSEFNAINQAYMCKNNWKPATYQALYQSNWYCSIGYKTKLP